MKKFIGYALLWIGIFYTGSVQGVFFFADYSRGETMLTRTALSIGLAVFSGAIIGYTMPKRWRLGILAAWLPIVFLFFGLLNSVTQGFRFSWNILVLFIPIITTLAASYAGAGFRAKNQSQLLWATLTLAAALFAITVLITSSR